ncbi:hypothetical protein FNV43_RR20948 [Rhamnella rubrinervis]|uniref:Protein kinase domain-containing protein n=1 Tax=Rhamnella rubrinervis TaxID=2594499 RepID=A0A8K0GXG1_9ROSA|nr:hypothetical protein FNV43_RR20948 [Rhamnella rubrinervis]
MLEGGAKFTGIVGLNNHENNYYDLSQGFYHKLEEGTNMSVDSFGSLQTSNDGGVNHRGRVTHALSNDALARALMDSKSMTQGLENYEEWTIDLRKLNMGRLLPKVLLESSTEVLTMFLVKRQNRSVPLKLAVKQALDVAREWHMSMGLIDSRDLKSDNLLIFADKSIKIADFGLPD